MQIEWSRHIMMAGALPLPAQSGAEQTGGVLRQVIIGDCLLAVQRTSVTMTVGIVTIGYSEIFWA